MSKIRSCAKRLLRFALGEYSLYYIYSWSSDAERKPPARQDGYDIRELDEHLVRSSSSSLLRDQIGYLGHQANAYGCFMDQRLAGLCVYWHGERYAARNFWPLRSREAKLVQIVVSPEMRGRGVATRLIEVSAGGMAERGFNTLYARIWHSNLPSIRAFQRAAWRRIALVAEINPLHFERPIRLQWKTGDLQPPCSRAREL